jgi:hypothetical protein
VSILFTTHIVFAEANDFVKAKIDLARIGTPPFPRKLLIHEMAYSIAPARVSPTLTRRGASSSKVPAIAFKKLWHISS